MNLSQINLQITPSLSVDLAELTFEFIKSAGPGGQNVNKVSTGVRLRFDILNSASLCSEVKSRLFKIEKNRINKEGILIIESQKYRTQEANKKDLLRKFSELLIEASHKPKKRVKTRPSRKSVERRLDTKSRRSKLKQSRKKPEW
ncbi:MAG: aminoacyl-tRNA hydrolase [Candidatus Dadabacteria bacterium]|nr:aminoacyl-tRNA hydrolase [Candidatus Dadabacteria bacterium]NIS09735.1 aminoacyl-tRNA hydrolase [Candidatus Dadabacteria bacterium]NIV41097.1 aminoacyl-tRNA hydrolase [Candidatus Dadabacteria bacterium]NIX16193.1 aminoacyl-tRNA hydrolase [Candidatus Dadabacteria bacterium]NIY22816.1 aminoacyl-tRNA hydrolase [Candidatus Dadabacteria bacterium]